MKFIVKNVMYWGLNLSEKGQNVKKARIVVLHKTLSLKWDPLNFVSVIKWQKSNVLHGHMRFH